MQNKLNRLRAVIELLSETTQRLNCQVGKLEKTFNQLQAGQEALPPEEQKQCFETLREGKGQ